VKHKMKIVRDVVKKLDGNKEYWKTLFGSYYKRCQRVVETGGELLNN